MKIIFNNGVELSPILVTGESRYIQGDNRDTLSFVFSSNIGIDSLDRAFTEAACESITIVGDDDSKAIYNGYVIRAELIKKSIEITTATESSAAVFEDRITVSMSQRTYIESKMKAMQDAIDMLCM